MKILSLGNRMKFYEGFETNRTFMPLLPILVRLDGKNFHSFTQGLQRPYDERMSILMKEITRQLVIYTSARIGYTQSDEVSLVLYSDNPGSQVFFDGSVFKIVSVLAAFASATFNKLLSQYLPEKASETPIFDCRAWNVPSKDEAVNALIWRELDATKNSISMAAVSYFSPEQLMGKTGNQKQEMLFSVGVNWNDYPAFFKRGVYLQRRKFVRRFTTDEIKNLPLKHQARTDPDLKVERYEVVELDMKLLKVANPVGVVFEGDEPVSHPE